MCLVMETKYGKHIWLSLACLKLKNGARLGDIMISVTHVEVEMAVRHLWGNVEPKTGGLGRGIWKLSAKR